MSKEYWVGLSLVAGIGPIKIKKLLEQFGSPEKVWSLSKEEMAAVPYIGAKIAGEFQRVKDETDLKKFLDECAAVEIHVLCPEDSEFPANLLNIYDPPPVIYYRGGLKQEDLYSIAIVGSRNMTAYGKRVTRMLATELAEKGFTIVSGMALGVDGVAHEAAIAAQGRTIAVLGSGVDVVYPPEHRKLYAEIIKSGAVLSTYPPGTRPEKGHFPARNRIISGLSLGTVVVEAGVKSGALITADLALEQNRDVFAIPGSIFSPQSAGCNALIAKGAKAVMRTKDILDELDGLHWLEVQQTNSNGVTSGVKAPELTATQTKVVHILAAGEMSLDDLLNELNLGVAELNTLLFELELAGVVTQLPGLKFALC